MSFYSITKHSPAHHDHSSSFSLNPNSRTLTFSLDKKQPAFLRNLSLTRLDGEGLEVNNFPFKPSISELPLSLYKDSRGKVEISKQQQFERLIQNKIPAQENRILERLKKEEEEVKNSCTFQPRIRISLSSKQHNNNTSLNNNPDSQEPVHDRLYQQAKDKQRDKDLSKLQLAVVKDSECTFQPSLLSKPMKFLNSQKHNLEPLYLRLREELRIQQQKKKALREKVQQEQEAQCIKFQALPKSVEILEARKQNVSKNVVQRLMQEVRERQKRRQAEQLKRQEEQKQKYTFTPAVHSSEAIGLKEDFLQRQEILAAQLRNKMATRLKQILKEEQCNFKPEINKVSDLLAEMQWGHEDPQERIERLHHNSQEKQKKATALNAIENEAYKECTFQPQINTISKLLEAEPVSHCCDKHDHSKQEDYDFRPAINPRSRELAASSDMIKNRKQQLAQISKQRARMELEYRELKQCTFKPKIKPLPSHIQKPQLDKVNGVDSFLKKVQISKQKQEQKKQIEERLFHLQKRYDERTEKNTRIQEFQLTKPNMQAMRQLRQEQIQQLAKECPFRPNTNRARERAIIQRIIS